MMLTNYNVYGITNFLSFLGGIWTIISVLFGAIIFSILRRNFWDKLAAAMIRKEEARVGREAREEGGMGRRWWK